MIRSIGKRLTSLAMHHHSWALTKLAAESLSLLSDLLDAAIGPIPFTLSSRLDGDGGSTQGRYLNSQQRVALAATVVNSDT